jgi:hypothetical protein
MVIFACCSSGSDVRCKPRRDVDARGGRPCGTEAMVGRISLSFYQVIEDYGNNEVTRL